MAKVTSYTAESTPAAGDFLYLATDEGGGSYSPKKVDVGKFFLADGTVNMTGEFVTDVGTFQSNVADGASNTGFVFDAVNGATAGFEIADFQAGGASKLTIDKDGIVLGRAFGRLGGTQTYMEVDNNNYYTFWQNGSPNMHLRNGVGMSVTENHYIGWGSTFALPGHGGSVIDTKLFRDGAAGVIAQRNDTNAQTSRLYGTYTDASNYERLSFITAAGDYTISPEAAGTGTLRGLKVGASGSKLGFLGATPVVQQSKISDPTGGATIDAEARTAINAIIDSLEAFGFNATV